MAEAMRGATKAMKSMNRQMKLPAMQKIMMEFSMESEAMDMKEEMMSDAIDDVMGEEDDEEEEELVIQQVLDEIGIHLGQQLVDAPSTSLEPAKGERVAVAEGGGGGEDFASLQARLDNLRK
jgi:charged multivesicular body protein 2A